MKKIFLDTNVLLDFPLQREGSDEARSILLKGYDKEIELYASSLSFSNIAYITRRLFRGNVLYETFRGLREMISVSDVTSQMLDQAVTLEADDFEDALQYYSAMGINAEAIITNNVKDFYFSSIPILTPREYLDL